jgi:hypothetical protein
MAWLTEDRLASLLTACLVGFVVGCGLLLVGLSPFVPGGGWMLEVGGGLSVLSLAVGMIGFFFVVAVRGQAVAGRRGGAQVRVAAQVFAVYRTDGGKVVDPIEDDLEKPGYHCVLMTPEGKRIEVSLDASLWYRCAEGMWGWAEICGDWMVAFVPDPELYSRYSRR